jgi:hypothetical protein
MSSSLAQIIRIVSNGEGEDTFWMQILVIVVLAALWGIYSLVRTRANRFKKQEQYRPAGGRGRGGLLRQPIKALRELKDKCASSLLKIVQPETIVGKSGFKFGGPGTASQEQLKNELHERRDLQSGMELLELDLLVSIVENTEIGDERDVMMRKLSFGELVRREELKAADSSALKVYAMNERNLYGKKIQCEAMRELTERTGLRSG